MKLFSGWPKAIRYFMLGVSVLIALFVIAVGAFAFRYTQEWKARDRFIPILSEPFGIKGIELKEVRHFYTGHFMDYPEYWRFVSTDDEIIILVKGLNLKSRANTPGEKRLTMENMLFPQWWKPEDLEDSVYYTGTNFYTVQRDKKTGITYVHKQL